MQKNRDDSKLLAEDEVKMAIHYTFERWNRVQNLEHKLGKEKSSVTEYENVTMISLLMEKNLFLLSTEPGSDYSVIIPKVNSTITKYLN